MKPAYESSKSMRIAFKRIALLLMCFYSLSAQSSDRYKPQSNISLLRSLDAGYVIIGASHTKTLMMFNELI
jgi:hypothetical protein